MQVAIETLPFVKDDIPSVEYLISYRVPNLIHVCGVVSNEIANPCLRIELLKPVLLFIVFPSQCKSLAPVDLEVSLLWPTIGSYNIVSERQIGVEALI